MTQVYETEEEETPPKEQLNSTQSKPTETPLGDVYDLYGMASNVHSKHTDMTRDYTLANFNSDIINAKFPKFIREQRKIVRILKSFMIVPLQSLQRKFNESYAKECFLSAIKSYNDVESLLLGEVDEMVIISRGGKGEVRTAILMHGKNTEAQEEYEQALETQTIGGKLTERTK